MPYSAAAVANYFIDLAAQESKTLTPMKVQKLVYYAHGWHLAITGEPLIDEQVEAWRWGPVIHSLYSCLAEHGNQAIRKPVQTVGFEKKPTGGIQFKFDTPRMDTSTEEGKFAAGVCRKVWDVFGKYTA